MHIEIKLAEKNDILKHEKEIYEALKGVSHFVAPTIKAYGYQSGYAYLITETGRCVSLTKFAQEFLPRSIVIQIGIEIVCIYCDI